MSGPHQQFVKLPDCEAVVEGEVVPVSKQRLVRSLITADTAEACSRHNGPDFAAGAGRRRVADGLQVQEAYRRQASGGTPAALCNLANRTWGVQIQSVRNVSEAKHRVPQTRTRLGCIPTCKRKSFCRKACKEGKQ